MPALNNLICFASSPSLRPLTCNQPFIQNMISLHTKFRMYNYRDSLAFPIAPEAKKDFRMAAIFLSYIL
jgi:hypothetical protein